MELRPLSPHYLVSPQISAEDIEAIADAGIKLVICNRPDEEVPESHQAEAIRIAAEARGLRFETLALTHQTMTPANVSRQASLAASTDGPVLAYCASGTRSSIVWALGQAGSMSADQILSSLSAAGYQLDALRPTLEQLAKA